MYYLYLLGFKLLYGLGLRKTSVRIARYLEQRYCYQPWEAAKLYPAISDFFLTQTFPLCDDSDAGCFLPILSEGDAFHKSCREKVATIEAETRAARDAGEDELPLAALADAQFDAEVLPDFCNFPGCYEAPGDNSDGMCLKHEGYCPDCESRPCVCPGMNDEESDDSDDELDDSAPDEECSGGCGQPEYACTCAELASWKRYCGTPLEQRDGSWTA